MALDFRAIQIRGNKLIASGSTGTNAKLLFYPFSSALNLSGGLNPTLFTTGSIGQDVFAYISGSIGSLDASSNGATVLGGDLHISGNLRVQGQGVYSSGPLILSGNLTSLLTTSLQGPTTASYLALNQGATVPYNKPLSSVNASSNNSFTLIFGTTAGILGNPTNTVAIGDFSNVNGIGFVGQSTIYGFLQSPTGSFFSGSIQFPQGISGSLTKLADGSSYLRAGTGIVVNSSSNGAITITGSAGKYGRLFIGKYTTTTNTSSNPQVCGQNYWEPSDWGFVSGSSGIYFQAILSAQTGSAIAYCQLWNATSGAYVEIGGVGVTALSTSQTTPTRLISLNLTGAVNFNTGSAQIYEVQIYTSVTSSTTFLGSGELLTQV